MTKLTPIVSRAKRNWYKSKKVKKLALDSQLLTVQILTNDVQMLILCLSNFITTVLKVNVEFIHARPITCSRHRNLQNIPI